MDHTGARLVAVAVLALVLASILACPPTTKWEGERPYFLVSPYGLAHDDPAPTASEPPEFPDLPLWDLEATRAELDALPEGAWLRWIITDASSKPVSKHDALVEALASTSRAARMLWWLEHMPDNADARDALVDAWARTKSDQTRLLLAIALALAHWEMSCPVELGPDGACRMPDVAITDDLLVRRDGIAVERARDWTKAASKLAKRAKIDPEDQAMTALLASLELGSLLDDYETALVASPPQGRSWKVADEQDIDRRAAFNYSQTLCLAEQIEGYERVQQASPNAALLASLRLGKLMLAFADDLDDDARNQRDRWRNREEHGTWSYVCGPWPGEIPGALATREARRCVEIGTTIGGSSEIVEACRTLVEAHDYERVPLAELVPEPAARTTLSSVGVQPPEMDQTESGSVERRDADSGPVVAARVPSDHVLEASRR